MTIWNGAQFVYSYGVVMFTLYFVLNCIIPFESFPIDWWDEENKAAFVRYFSISNEIRMPHIYFCLHHFCILKQKMKRI